MERVVSLVTLIYGPKIEVQQIVYWGRGVLNNRDHCINKSTMTLPGLNSILPHNQNHLSITSVYIFFHCLISSHFLT